MLVLQSSLSNFELFNEYEEDEIMNAIKNSTKKELIIVRTSEGFFKYEGRRQNCSKTPVDIKIMVKKPPTENDGPKMSDDEKLGIFKEWYEANKRTPNPNEIYNGVDVDKFFRKFYKDGQFVDKVREFIKPKK